MSASAAIDAAPATARPGLRREIAVVLGVSLGASAIWSVLAIIERLTKAVPLNQQTTAMNSSVTPDRPWLDLAYQLTTIGLALVPVGLALYLLGRVRPAAPGRASYAMGFDLRSPRRDLVRGATLAALIGIPGLAFYLVARSVGLNTSVAAANLTAAWWTVPVLVLAATQNAVLEEVVVVGYLFTRVRQLGAGAATTLWSSALLRGSYHLYQGFGGFAGNVAMGLVFGMAYRRWGRVMPLVVAHTLLDVVAFVGYSALKGRLGWL